MNNNHELPAILLIEKDEVTLEIYERELRKSFTVFASTEIDNALEMLESQIIQAVVIEPEIHSGRGWDLIDTLHQVFPGRLIPVIVCSTRDANIGNSGKNIALYLTKPVLPKTLRQRILGVIGA